MANINFGKAANFGGGKKGFFENREKGTKNDPSSTGNGGGVLEDMSDACKLSWKQRMIGFVSCALIGLVLGLLGYLCLIIPGPNKFRKFAIIFTLGNIVALMSTGFLVGPLKQLKKMLEGGRIVFTLIYFGMMGLTLFFGFKKKAIPCIICMVLQIIAFICYALSYMPIIRRVVVRTLGIHKVIK